MRSSVPVACLCCSGSIDVFLVIIAALLLAVANNPTNPFSKEKVTIIQDRGQPDVEIAINDEHKVERYARGMSKHC